MKWYNMVLLIMISVPLELFRLGLYQPETEAVACTQARDVFFPGSPILSSKATFQCCVKEPVHLWVPFRNLRALQESSRESWAPGTPYFKPCHNFNFITFFEHDPQVIWLPAKYSFQTTTSFYSFILRQ